MACVAEGLALRAMSRTAEEIHAEEDGVQGDYEFLFEPGATASRTRWWPAASA